MSTTHPNPWFDTLPGPRLAEVIEQKGDALKERYYTDDVMFAIWMHAVDRAVMRRVLVSAFDLEDWMYRDAYDAGQSPRDAAIDMLDDNGYGDAYDEALR